MILFAWDGFFKLSETHHMLLDNIGSLKDDVTKNIADTQAALDKVQHGSHVARQVR